MYKKLFFIIALPFMMTACLKSSSSIDCNYTAPTTVAPATEIAVLKKFLDDKSLPYIQHPSGIFYHIVAPGSGATPAVCNDVTVKYSGVIAGSSTPFDSNSTGVTFTLGRLILGWQIGIPLIQPGGSMILYVPPTLGYGASGAGASIPPNSYLAFTIDLVNVK
jgi:FKBP-type peptidyl-prolyl cis-trans isomerase FkpA